MSKSKLYFFIPLFCSLFIVLSCNNNDDEGVSGSHSLRTEILTNVGNNIILPNYQDLQNKTQSMNESVSQFNSETTLANLQTLKETFKEAYRAWQYTSVFEFGPAESQILRASVNTFPTSTGQINANIQAGTYNLGTANNLAAKGFPAIDYLLFGIAEDENAVLAQYASGESSENYKAYLAAVSNDILTKVTAVYQEWTPAGGDYLDRFINASGTDVGSSFGQLVNQLNFDYEIIKNPKIGIPLGKKTLGEKLPANVEAYYSGISNELAILNVKAIEDIYLGRSKSGTNGSGLDNYLEQLNARYNGGSLADAIKSQFENVKNAMDQVPDPLSEAIIENTAVVENAYTEIQKTVVLIKTDMPSAMGILITYQDNDGD